MGFDNDTNLVQLYDIFDDEISLNNSGYSGVATSGNESALEGYTCENDVETTSASDDSDDSDDACILTSFTRAYVSFFFVFLPLVISYC